MLEEPAFTELGPPTQSKECPRPFSALVRNSNEGVTPGPTSSLAAASIESRRERVADQHQDDRRFRTPAMSDNLYMSDTGTIHPFENLWQPGSTVREISLALPTDDTFTRYSYYLKFWTERVETNSLGADL